MELLGGKRPVADAVQFIVEPPDLWTSRLSREQQELAPKVAEMPDGGEGWAFDGGAWMRPLDLHCAVGEAAPQARLSELRYADIRKGTYDANERINDMDVDGIAIAAIFPTFGLDIRSIADPSSTSTV